MTGADFVAWREQLGITRTEACVRLGLHANSITNYEKGRTTIPLYIALACAAVAKKLKPWRQPC